MSLNSDLLSSVVVLLPVPISVVGDQTSAPAPTAAVVLNVAVAARTSLTARNSWAAHSEAPAPNGVAAHTFVAAQNAWAARNEAPVPNEAVVPASSPAARN